MSDMGCISVILKITYRDANPEGKGMYAKMRPWSANSVLRLNLHSGTVTLIKKGKKERACFGQLCEDTSQVAICKQRPSGLASCSWSSSLQQSGKSIFIVKLPICNIFAKLPPAHQDNILSISPTPHVQL